MEKQNQKWEHMGPLECAGALQKVKGMIRDIGDRRPLEVIAREQGLPPLRKSFQIVVRPDGFWVSAALKARLGAIAFHKFMADCDRPSNWRLANPAPGHRPLW